MKRGWAVRILAVCILLAAVAGCGRRGEAPALVKVDATRFAPAVRETVEKAQREAEDAPDDAGRALAYGMALHAHDQFGAAAAAYRRALALEEKTPNAAYYLGAALAADGKYGEALEPLRRAAGEAPEVEAVRLRLADALFASGDPEGARREYEALAARGGAAAQVHYGLGRTLSGDRAEAELQKALEIFPRYGAAQFALAGLYRRSGRTAEAEKVLANYDRDKTAAPPVADAAMEKIQDLNVSSTGLIRKAQILDSQGRTEEALAVHEQVVSADPKMEQAWENLISLYGRTGEAAKAEAAYRKAAELAPGRADVHYNFGVLCYGLGRFGEAEAAFRKALELDSGHAEAAHNLGLLRGQAGDFDGAARMYGRAIELEPGHRLARFHLAQIYAGRREYGKAEAELEKIVEPADAQSPTYLYALGAVQARAGKAGKARVTLEKARDAAARMGQNSLAEKIGRDLGAVR